MNARAPLTASRTSDRAIRACQRRLRDSTRVVLRRRPCIPNPASEADGDLQRDWKDGETRESRLVFIGRDLNENELRKGFEACAA